MWEEPPEIAAMDCSWAIMCWHSFQLRIGGAGLRLDGRLEVLELLAHGFCNLGGERRELAELDGQVAAELEAHARLLGERALHRC